MTYTTQKQVRAIDEADRLLDLAQRADTDMNRCQYLIKLARNALSPHVPVPISESLAQRVTL